PEIACCAILPSAKCEGDLLSAGVTHSELAILQGTEEAICPSATLSESRIRELGAIWAASPSCRQTRTLNRTQALDGGLCSVRSLADAPPLPDGVDQQVAATCAAGLVARGVSEPELWIVIGDPAGVCPNNGVTEQRLRKIIADDWAPASCTQFTKEQMLHALDTGACGGNAG
ncbi:MAG: hypothetical protein ABMA14_26765, partial [Hyphomonadaceae bacterium]